ncbi:MAG: ATP-binding protein, partial [Kofleriaceae bacterium]
RHLGALGQPPYPVLAGPELEQYLDVTRRWIVCLCHTAIAIAPATSGAAPAAELVARARAAERAASEAFAAWSDRGSPHVELAVELGLSPMATTILLIAAAPQIWGEIARTYGPCTADPARPLVDELLLAHLLEATTATRAAIARELDDDAPLVRSGAIEVGRGLRPYAAITVHPAIARRLAGAPVAGDPGPATTPHELAALIGPRAAIDALARTLVAPRVEPVRVVLRGRPAAGRRTIAAALAALAGRRIGLVDGSAEPPVLRARLRDVTLRGDLPCVTLDQLSEEPASHASLRAILDAHPGPLFVRAPLGGDLPLAPGYASLELPSPSETERRAAWREMLCRHALDPAIADELAARFSVGPGAIHRACAAVVASGETGPTAAVAITAALRQHRAARIEAIATRVDRLAAWEDLIVSPEIDDALRELIARVSHRRTVLEEWGMDRVAATAQGVTALLQGGPGTGKTLAAGAIARALGYELWRVDLSKVLSKWIGETEKNLAAVFDAAEDGEIVLLFDEADSLFGRRTTGASSQDRHANVKTNYLLQRLDSFSGIAILTTNLGTAIDPAFRRRLSVQIQFPFPDAGDRERLWRAHLPRSLPIEGELDLGELARRHQLSGGYIRNAALRAAYLAAAERRALSADHLRRAVALEYQRAGKLGDGRLE